METAVAFPFTCQRSVEDWPRWMDVGSAENCATTGAGGAAGGGVTTGAGAGAAGGGGGGAFFLQPAAKRASVAASVMAAILRLLNMNDPSRYVGTSTDSVTCPKWG